MTRILAILALAWSFQADSAPFVYVAQPLAGSVAVIDAATSTVTATIPVGSQPVSIAINRSGARGYVVNSGSNSVSVLDLTNNTAVSSIAVDAPWGIVIDPAETRLYVSSTNRTVSILDARSGSLVAVVPLADEPLGLAVDPTGSRVYVLYAQLGTIAVIDTATNTIFENLNNRPDLLPSGFAVASTGGQLYVANNEVRSSFIPPASPLLTVVDANGSAPVVSIDVGDQVNDVTAGPQTNRAYVATYSHVKVVDTGSNSVIASIPVTAGSNKIALDSSSGRVYVTNFRSDLVTAVDLATGSLVTIDVAGPYTIAVGPPAAMSSAQAVPLLSKTTLTLLVLSIICLACIAERRRSSRSAR